MKVLKVNELPIKHIKSSIKPTTNKKEDLKLRHSAKQLEGLFLTFVLKAMEKTIPKFDDKASSNNLASMMFSLVLGEDLAEKGGVGLANFIYRNMSKEQHQKIDLPTQNWLELIPTKLISRGQHE